MILQRPKAVFFEPYGSAGIVALGPSSALASVPERNVLYFIYQGMVARVVAGSQDPPSDQPGYIDARAEDARFNKPTALARLSDGSFLIADSQNRLIRQLPPLNLRWAVTDVSQAPRTAPSNCYHIVYVSNSMAFFNTMWDDSIPGRIERLLNKSKVLTRGKAFRVDAVRLSGSSLEAQSEYIREILAEGDANLVIWNLNELMFIPRGSVDLAQTPDISPEQQHVWLTTFQTTAEVLSKHGIRLALVDEPLGMVAGPGEGFGFKRSAAKDSHNERFELETAEHGLEFYSTLENVMHQVPLQSYFTYETYNKYEQGPHLPLFGPYNFHPTPSGNSFHADLIVQNLLEQHPWK